jgi:hypothetical protein
MDVQLFLTLVAGHFLADFALQTDFMAAKKRKVFVESMGIYALTAHASIHGLVAGLICQNLWAGIVVGSSHWLIDFVRSSDVMTKRLANKKGPGPHDTFGIHADQFLHVLVLIGISINLQ